MLFEQAFMALPEFLTGAPFRRYRFEGTVLTAFSMAVLQELNSRNIPNPVSLLRAEVEYPADPAKRADLHIDLRNLNVFNDDLRSYGFYENNWLEAKFCRVSSAGTPVISALDSTFLLLKDLIRLCSLVPDAQIANEKSEAGRYLLHAYQNDPKAYFVYRRNGGGARSERSWIGKLIDAGNQTIEIDDLRREHSKTFARNVGSKAGLIKMRVNLTNLVHKPYAYADSVYHIVLSRINDFEITVGKRTFRRIGGIVTESVSGFGLLMPKVVGHILTN